VVGAGGLLLLVLLEVLGKHQDKTVERLRWAAMMREVIRTDTRMLAGAIRLSVAHAQAMNRMRKLGGGR
jgi:hypothetical protein